MTPPASVVDALPTDLDAEAVLLGAMIIDATVIPDTCKLVTAADFYQPRHQLLFSAITKLHGQGQPVDLVLLPAALRAAGQLEKVGGLEYLDRIVEGTPSAASYAYYARLVRGKADLRRIIVAADSARAAALAPDADAGAIVADFATQAQAGEQGSNPTTRPAYLSAAELMERFPMQPAAIIERLLRRREVANLVSGPKMFKSWLLLFIALCIATGREVFGFPTRQGRVLLLDYELAPGTLAKRLQAVMQAMGIGPDDVGDRLAIEPLRGKRLDVFALATYFERITAGQFDLIVIDPLYRTFPPDIDENSNANLAHIYGLLQRYAEGLDAAIIVVHHLTKGDQSGRAVTDLGAGGGSQSRAADAHLAIRSHAEDGAAVLSGVLRSFPPFEPLAIRWNFPLWELAPDLDPADLKRSTTRGGAAKPPKVEGPPKPAKMDFDTPGFVVAFIGPEPKAGATIIAAAQAQGLTERRAKGLLQSAEGQGIAHRWRVGRTNLAHFADRPQPKLTDEVRADQ